MTTDFESVLQTQADTIEKPPLMPEGGYSTVIKKFELGESSKKKTKFVDFTVGIQAPMDDVDQSIIDEIGMDKIIGKERNVTFYLTPDALWRLTDFLGDDVGLDKGGKSIEQLINEAVGQEVGITIRHKPTADGTDMYPEVSGTFAV